MNHPPTRSLRDLAKINPRGSRVSPDELVSFVGMADLDEVAARNTAETPRRFGEVSKGYTPFQNGDLLAAKITPCWQNGKVGEAVLTSEHGMGSTEFHVIRPGPDVDRRYLLHFLRTANVRDAGTLRMTGSGGQRRVPAKFMSDLPVPSLPLQEQRRIASILDEADTIRRKRRAQLVELEKLRPTLFHRMFGERSPDCELGDLIIEGPTNGLYKPASSYGEGTPILRIDSFSNGYMRDNPWRRVQTTTDEFAKYSIREGDIVINRVNALSHLGKAILIEDLEEPSVFESNMMRLRLDSAHILPEYVISWLLTSDARQQIAARAKKAINQASINQSDVRGLLLPKPSIDEQRVFANSVNAIRAERDRVAKALEADEELFAALQHTAFRGEL